MAQLEFLYTQAQLQDIAATIIQKALAAGASSAQVELSESISTDVEILSQEIDNFETSHETQLLISVFKGHKKGNIGISAIKQDNLDNVILQALDIAKYTEEDSANGLLESEYIVKELHSDLELYNPYELDNHELIRQAKELELLALEQDQRIKVSDGSSISLTRYNFVTANSNGLLNGYQTSRYSKYVSLIGENSAGMQTDYWHTSSRAYPELMPNQQLAAKAAQRVLRRLNKGEYTSGKPAVIFESSIAKSIIGSLMGALSGGSLYRRLSFLNDSLGTKIMPEWLTINENPFILKGMASCYFDNEGSQVQQRDIIANGAVNGYLLSSYSARKMNLTSTGNAGGNHNIVVSHNFVGELAKLARHMKNGIIIIDTIGHGLNMVSGDYSVGASGLVVINGEISHFVDNLTIAGNMRDIYQNIAAISNDYENSSVCCGSMLINPGVIQVSSK
jgi:PmbA protein